MQGLPVALSSIQNELYQAVNDPVITKIIMCFDSPGGSITGINEFAETIKAISTPCTAYIQGSATSAAFWLAAACDEIVCDSTSILGSIGVVGTFQKNSDSKIEIVSSHAQDKRPDVESKQGQAVILKTLNDLETVFVASLTKLRPILSKDSILSLNGGILIGSNAVKAGFADGIGSLRNLIAGIPIDKNPSVIAGAHSSADNSWTKASDKLRTEALGLNSKESRMQSSEEKNDITDNPWIKAAAKLSNNS